MTCFVLDRGSTGSLIPACSYISIFLVYVRRTVNQVTTRIASMIVRVPGDGKGDHTSSDSGVHVSSVTLPTMKRRTAATHTHTGRMENHRGGWGVGGAFSPSPW